MAADRRAPHVVLVGLPGAGKSAVGAALASELGRAFMDLDAELERREGMTIAAMFGARGEAGFRALEHALTVELRDRDGMVLAPGGGWVMHSGNVALLRPPGLLVWLRVTPETAVRRMGSAVAERPLLRGPDPADALRRLLGQREGAYGDADLMIDTEDVAPQEVARQVAQWMRSWSEIVALGDGPVG